MAASNGHDEIVRLLLKAKAKVDTKDKARAPVRRAEASGVTGTVFIRERTHPPARSRGCGRSWVATDDTAAQEDRTALMCAASAGSASVCTVLLEVGVDVQLTDKVGCQKKKQNTGSLRSARAAGEVPTWFLWHGSWARAAPCADAQDGIDARCLCRARRCCSASFGGWRRSGRARQGRPPASVGTDRRLVGPRLTGSEAAPHGETVGGVRSLAGRR